MGAGLVEEVEDESEGVGDGDAGLFREVRLRSTALRVGSVDLCPKPKIPSVSRPTEFQPNTVSFRGGVMLAIETNPLGPDDISTE
jgi:hypothetical protein